MNDIDNVAFQHQIRVFSGVCRAEADPERWVHTRRKAVSSAVDYVGYLSNRVRGGGYFGNYAG